MTTQLENDLEGLEHQKKVAEVNLAFSARVEKLLKNPDFRAVILDEYCVHEAARFVGQSCDPIMSKEKREDCLAMAQASGHLKRWLQMTQTAAGQIGERMLELDNSIEEVRAAIAAGETED